jgi:hypothetical protein
MKANKVSALRGKRGLHRVKGAEPPIEAVSQLTDTNPNNHEQLSNIERKTDTMKTYILRHCKPVEPQKSIRLPRPKTRRLGEPAPPGWADPMQSPKALSCSSAWTCTTTPLR